MGALPGDLDRLLHDLRGPLNAATMHLEVLKRTGLADPTGLASLEAIRQELTRLGALLPAVFGIMAVECGERGRVDLEEVVRRTLAEPGLGAVTVAAGPWPPVYADARLLALAVGHLAHNALTATAAAGPGRPAPEVSARAAGPGQVMLVVRDWGAGLRTTNARALIRLAISPVTGRPAVGLATVERIARLHGGALEFRSPADGGAEVSLTLPAA
jgi:signal transduction histidine kinase